MKSVLKILIVVVWIAVATADEIPEADSEALLTDEQIETLLERAQEESAAENDDCNNESLLSCIGFDRTTCESLQADVMEDCTLPMARDILASGEGDTETLELDHAKCTLELAEKRYRIAPKRYFDCMPNGTYEKPGPIRDWLENR